MPLCLPKAVDPIQWLEEAKWLSLEVTREAGPFRFGHASFSTKNENKHSLDFIAGIYLLRARFVISTGTAGHFLTGESRLVWAVVGEGVQIYEAKPNPAGGYKWALKAPEAELKDLSGKLFGKHFAGPSWSANDGSEIEGALPPLTTWTSDRAKNIAWLLVAVKSRSGAGVLDKVDYVVPISTEGGVPPDELPASERETARVNYRAIYLFLQKAG